MCEITAITKQSLSSRIIIAFGFGVVAAFCLNVVLFQAFRRLRADECGDRSESEAGDYSVVAVSLEAGEEQVVAETLVTAAGTIWYSVLQRGMKKRNCNRRKGQDCSRGVGSERGREGCSRDAGDGMISTELSAKSN